ncbi:MAG TPA: type ISP restriction/modification enzyme, partial [Pirellulaceae bacterium]|nr:type ISP restriction/modification enzyme [Pirellulaceae bacterium]
QRTRSARYQRGDTRSWKLPHARRAVAADEEWQGKIVRCLYRPFDWRYVFWHPAMIDWPRDEMTRHLLHADFKSQPRGGEGERGREGETGSSPPLPRSPSLALIARRQQLPTQPCTFFWIADGLALDGVIRSDNRGSESLFPLYSHDTDDGDQPVSRANFEPRIVTKIAKTVQWSWQPLGSGDLTTNFGPEDLLAYIYALFHSPNYRQRYAEELRSNFPRILPPRSAAQFRTFVNFGRELIDLHLLRTLSPSPSLHLSPSINEFRAGGYLALKKWLQPPHRSPADPQYGQIAAAIARTLEIMDQIDGGMP